MVGVAQKDMVGQGRGGLRVCTPCGVRAVLRAGGPGLMRSVTQRPALRSKLLRGVSLASPGAPL